MKITLNHVKPHRPGNAFTLPEIMISIAIFAIIFVSLYGGISSGFAAVNFARENMRSTQILTEKMEEFRTFSWDQIISNTIPTTFTEYFYPTNLINSTNSGVLYSGTVGITNANLTESYNTNLKLINVQVTWQSGRINHTNSMQTIVSQYGMRNYIY